MRYYSNALYYNYFNVARPTSGNWTEQQVHCSNHFILSLSLWKLPFAVSPCRRFHCQTTCRQYGWRRQVPVSCVTNSHHYSTQSNAISPVHCQHPLTCIRQLYDLWKGRSLRYGEWYANMYEFRNKESAKEPNATIAISVMNVFP